jgi:hypothetical protein
MRVRFLTEQNQGDPYVKDNFRRLAEAIEREDLLRGNFKFFEIVIAQPEGAINFSYPHNLGFVPKDILTLSASNNNPMVTWHFDSFTDTNLVLSTSDDCTIRCFVGTYK